MSDGDTAVHIVGLGPGPASLVTVETQHLLGSGVPVILRTRHHPAVGELSMAGPVSDCDDLYGAGRSFTDVYQAVAGRVLDAASRGPVIFATPGHPLVAEASVGLVLAGAAAAGIAVGVYPAVSFLDVASVALRMDLGGVQVCDALDLRVDTWRPAIVSQVYDRDTVTAVKLALLELYPPEHRVTVLSALGTPEEATSVVALAELDHHARGHLDALFLPALDPLDDVRRFDGLAYVIERLHAPDGCPWDREQTHETLRPHLLEESYEALEAIDSGDPAAIEEELGDVLLQVLMHAAVGKRTGDFTLADVVEHINRKLVRRHPHVFGETVAATAEQVHRNWQALKQQEKPRSSVLEGVPATLPSLAASQAIQGRARRAGFDWPDIDGPLEKLREELEELARAGDAAGRDEEFGDVLFVAVNIADHLGIDAEHALRAANAKFRLRFGAMEALARERGADLQAMDLAAMDALWDEVKAASRGAL